MNPIVSIIIPCYNAEKWLDEAIQSCINQTYHPIEIIVIDDSSTDGSLKIIKQHAQQYPDMIRWQEMRKNQGAAAARNRGIQLSNGRYLQFLDADDWLLREKLEKQIQYIRRTQAQLVFSDWYVYQQKTGKKSLRTSEIFPLDSQDYIYYSVSTLNCPHTSSFLVNRPFLNKHDVQFDETLKSGQEWDLLLQLAYSNCKFSYLQGAFSVKRKHNFPGIWQKKGTEQLSTENLYRLRKWKRVFEKQEKLNEYKYALNDALFSVAQILYSSGATGYKEVLEEIYETEPDFKPRRGNKIFKFLVKFIGIKSTMRFAKLWKQCFKS